MGIRTVDKAAKISDDVGGNWDWAGEYRENGGSIAHGIYEVGNNQWRERAFIGNGVLLASYLFPKIENRFKCQLVDNFNLHLCGGWSWRIGKDESISGKVEDRIIFERVAQKMKPIGFIISKDRDYLLEYQHQATNAGLSTVFHPNPPRKDLWELGIANIGKLETFFDFDALTADYVEYMSVFDDNGWMLAIMDHLEIIRSSELSEYIHGFDYSSADRGFNESVTTGLVLGYPPETTIATSWYDFLVDLAEESGYSRKFVLAD